MMENFDIIDNMDLNNCPECYEPIQYMGFIPADTVYFITCPNYKCGHTLADIKKDRLIKRWNKSKV